MKNKDVVGIDVSKLTIDAYIQLPGVHAVFENNTRGFKQLIKWIKINDEFGSFDKYIWQFTNFQTIVNSRKSMSELPASTAESDAMSKDMKKRGFKFCGTTICYAFMQAVGMVNDHTVDCFCYERYT